MIGIIGGSGLEKPEFLTQSEKKEIQTPFGKTSGLFTVGKIGNADAVLVSRHGFQHEYTPSKVPYQANLWALKELGVKNVLASSACGSLREEIQPGDFPSLFLANPFRQFKNIIIGVGVPKRLFHRSVQILSAEEDQSSFDRGFVHGVRPLNKK